MKPEVVHFSFAERAAEKAAARERDEAQLLSGEVSRADMAHINGGSLRSARYKGPCERIRAFAASYPPRDQD